MDRVRWPGGLAIWLREERKEKEQENMKEKRQKGETDLRKIENCHLCEDRCVWWVIRMREDGKEMHRERAYRG